MAQVSALDKAMAVDDFVDLYEVLHISVDAEASDIRKRINELYIESQQNLDHRNIKKRLQFQQMFEIYLPQARHLLLDKKRRAEYDRYLHAFRSGNRVESGPPMAGMSATSAGTAPTTLEANGPAAAPAVSDNLVENRSDVAFHFEDPELADLDLAPPDPAKLAAEREHLWSRWKTGLEHTIVDEPQARAGQQTASARQATPAAPPQRPQTAPAPAPSSAAVWHGLEAPATPKPQPAPRPYGAPAEAVAAPASLDGLSAEEIERRREHRRYALIKSEVENVGLRWALWTGFGYFMFGCVCLFLADDRYFSKHGYPLGFPRSIGNLIIFIGIIMVAALISFFTSRWSRQKAVNQLSSLSLEDLIRRQHTLGRKIR